MKIYRKPLLVCGILLAYVTSMVVYLLPRNTEMESTEKIVTVGMCYVVIVALFFVMQKREKLRRKRLEDKQQNSSSSTTSPETK